MCSCIVNMLGNYCSGTLCDGTTINITRMTQRNDGDENKWNVYNAISQNIKWCIT